MPYARSRTGTRSCSLSCHQAKKKKSTAASPQSCQNRKTKQNHVFRFPFFVQLLLLISCPFSNSGQASWTLGESLVSVRCPHMHFFWFHFSYFLITFPFFVFFKNCQTILHQRALFLSANMLLVRVLVSERLH